MILEWEYGNLKYDDQLFLFMYNGIFLMNEENVSYYYGFTEPGISKMIEVSFDNKGNLLFEREYHPKSYVVPSEWQHIYHQEESYIFLNEHSVFDEKNKIIIYDAPKLTDIYNKIHVSDYHLSDDPFVFDPYIISHKGAYGYVCHMDKTLLWKLSGQGYLYTDMEKYDNLVVFGTAGAGGHFYGIDISTGKSVIDINTKGTGRFYFKNGYFYIYQCGDKGKLLKVSMTGNVEEEILLPGKVTIDCPLALINDKIFTLSFKFINKTMYSVIGCYSI